MENCRIKHDTVDLNLKNEFPMLDDDKVYLDSASTSFTPKSVIKDINEYLTKYEANYNRGLNDLVININNKINGVRKKVADFLEAKKEQISFTSGATLSSYLITNKFAINELDDKDEIMLCNLDHSSTIKPWLELKELFSKFNKCVIIKEILIDVYGDYLEDDLISKVNNKTKYIILTHIHNVYGLEMNIESLVLRIRRKNPNVKIVLDVSQSISHIKVSVKELDVDYLYFSGHKMFAPTGIGILYTRNECYKDIEYGTPNILGIIGLGSAIDFINSIGIKNIEDYVYNLTRYLYSCLLEIKQIEFNKGINYCKCKLGYGIISFKHKKIPSSEINEILNYYKIYVRSNNFCQNGQDEYIRISLNIYNTKNDIDKFIKVLKSIDDN